MTITVPSIDRIEIARRRLDCLGRRIWACSRSAQEAQARCRGRPARPGGVDPCVTDADVGAGHPSPKRFPGRQDMQLRTPQAPKRRLDDLGAKLSLPRFPGCLGRVRSRCEARMAAATRTAMPPSAASITSGLPLLASGWSRAGACVAWWPSSPKSTKVIYPPLASVLSPFGSLGDAGARSTCLALVSAASFLLRAGPPVTRFSKLTREGGDGALPRGWASPGKG